jgi:hypothetical protein
MIKKISLLISLCIILVACAYNPNNGDSSKKLNITPTFIQLSNGLGGVIGFYDGFEQWEDETLQIFAAPYLGDPEGEGIFIFEAKMENAAYIEESGFFQIPELEPGLYILLIGPDINQAEAYQKGGNAIKVEVFAGEYTDVGIIDE